MKQLENECHFVSTRRFPQLSMFYVHFKQDAAFFATTIVHE